MTASGVQNLISLVMVLLLFVFFLRVKAKNFLGFVFSITGFKVPTGKYIENSLTTLNQKDPVAEYNSILWNSGTEANKDIARKQKRRLTYIANVLVVSDPKHPENEGQVKLFKFGKKNL